MRSFFNLLGVFAVLVLLQGCLPKNDIQFKGVKNIIVEQGENGELLLKGEALFFNPNDTKMKLKGINIDVFVNDKKSAVVKQHYNLPIPGNSDFKVPVVAQISLKEIGLLDTIVGLFGGKKYKVRFSGSVKIKMHGLRVPVPVNYTEELKLKF